MDNIFCTLFDSAYLDRGLVLYSSMVEHLKEFKLYVFAFDEKSEEILKSENLSNIVVVGLEEFETDELLEVKKSRTRAEYCWTCSPWVIKHVLEHYNEEICTYIDADMMFFSSPQVVFDDMREKNCSVLITPHRFKSEEEERKAHHEVGSYCVEFNTFLKDENGMEALNWWAKKCLEWCFYAVPGTTEWYGDQKYLNVFPEKFQGVYICNHYGIGMAPWNASLVEATEYENVPVVKVKKTGAQFPIVVYHFEGVGFITNRILHAPSNIKSKKLHHDVYDLYVNRLIENRNYLKQKYDFDVSKKRRTVTNNMMMKIYQKYIMPFRRVKSLKDMYWI